MLDFHNFKVKHTFCLLKDEEDEEISRGLKKNSTWMKMKVSSENPLKLFFSMIFDEIP